MPKHRGYTGSLYHTTVLGNIAKQHSKTTILGISMLQIANTTILTVGIQALPLSILTTHLGRELTTRCRMIDSVGLWVELTSGDIIFLHLFVKSMTINSHYRAVDKSSLVELIQYTHDSSCTVAFLHTVLLSVRTQLAETRHLAAQLIDVLHLEVGASLLSHSQQVKHGIGTSAHGDIQSHGIEECITGSDIAWQYALVAILIISISILNHLTCCILEELNAVLVSSQDGTIARKAQTDSLSKRVHGIGSKHTRATTASRTCTLLYLSHLLIRDTGVSTLDHCSDQVGILAFPSSCLHRATRTEYSRDVQTHRSHQHTRSHLVTIGDANHGISLMCIYHILHRIGDDITAWK